MRAAALLLLTLTLASCELPKGTPPEKSDMAASRELDALGREILWEVIKVEVSRFGFDIDAEVSSEAAGTFETHWINELQPFRYEGRRKKLKGVFEESPDRPGKFRVLLVTWMQRNADMEEPLNPAKAIWQNVDPDMGTTGRILKAIERHFREPDPMGGR